MVEKSVFEDQPEEKSV